MSKKKALLIFVVVVAGLTFIARMLNFPFASVGIGGGSYNTSFGGPISVATNSPDLIRRSEIESIIKNLFLWGALTGSFLVIFMRKKKNGKN